MSGIAIADQSPHRNPALIPPRQGRPSTKGVASGGPDPSQDGQAPQPGGPQFPGQAAPHPSRERGAPPAQGGRPPPPGAPLSRGGAPPPPPREGGPPPEQVLRYRDGLHHQPGKSGS